MPPLLRDQVYQALKEDILEGVYVAGERLSVSALLEQYHVSATPIREALNRLELEDLVDIIPGVGCFVSHLSIQDIRDIFQLRLIVESASAELAAQRISDEELMCLESFHRGYSPGDVNSYWRYLAENRDFHCAVAQATRNRWLVDTVGRLLDQMHRVLLLRLDLRNCADEQVEEHRQLVATLRARDSARARSVMAQAIENAREAVLEAIMVGKELPINTLARGRSHSIETDRQVTCAKGRAATAERSEAGSRQCTVGRAHNSLMIRINTDGEIRSHHTP